MILATAVALGLAGTASTALALNEDEGSSSAAAPSTRPADPENDREDRRGDQGEEVRGDRDDRDRRDDRDGRRRFGENRGGPTEQEWEETVRFLAEHAPRRLAIYNAFLSEWERRQGQEATAQESEASEESEPPPHVKKARGPIFWRVEMLRSLERSHPELYAFALRQFKLEDEIIGALQDARDAEHAENEEAAEAAHERARAALKVYAENTLKEREARLEHLRRELAREEEKLSRDHDDFEELLSKLEERFKRMLPPEPGEDEEDRDRRRGWGESSGR